MRSVWISGALTLAALATPAASQAPAPDAAKGQAVYEARCKECHESGDERALTRAQLAAKTPAEIVTALTTGPMAPMAEGLTPEDKQAVAAYLTAK